LQLILFYLSLIIVQGSLAALLAPLPAPDLFLLGALTLLWRLPAWQMVLVAYGVGLLQDLMGHGALGFHAFGLAGAVLGGSAVASRLNQAGFSERLLIVTCAILGKWIMFAMMLQWFGNTADLWTTLSRVAPLDALFTLLASMLLLPIAEWLIERDATLKRELL
jgi:rod shape-determining protein MreD